LLLILLKYDEMKQNIKEQIIFIDNKLIVINKPAGLLTIPDRYDPDLPNLVNLIENIFGQVWVVHRLDRQTSGIILLARDSETHQKLSLLFENREVNKSYHALISGCPDWEKKTIDLPLMTDGDRSHRTIVDKKSGKPAQTNLRVIERFRHFTLLEACPKTGYTHQIRVHLAAINYPVLVDNLYGKNAPLFLSDIKTNYHKTKDQESPLLSRLALHAHSISFNDPAKDQPQMFTAPYPKDFFTTLQKLRKFDT